MEKSRPSWDSIWMNFAKIVSKRSECRVPNREVGCVIVSEDNSRCLAIGYNGLAAGSNDVCSYDGSDNVINGTSRCTCIHAEMNALAKLNTTDPCKKTCYLTLSPCPVCASLLVNAKIDRVIFLKGYDNKKSFKILKDAGIKVFSYDPKCDVAKLRLYL